MQDRPSIRPATLAIATALAYVCNPLLYSVAGFVLVALYLGASPMETTWIGIVALTFFKVIPLAILAGLIRAGKIDTVEVRSRERRTVPFLLGSLSMAFGCAVFFMMGTEVSRLVAMLAAVSVLSAGILTVITQRWKISIHASAAGAFAGLTLYFAINAHVVQAMLLNPNLLAIAACMLLPAVAWARVHTDAHTPAQVVAGSGFGFFMSVVPLYWLVPS